MDQVKLQELEARYEALKAEHDEASEKRSEWERKMRAAKKSMEATQVELLNLLRGSATQQPSAAKRK